MTILEKLSEIEARAEKVANVRSDDFGHSCDEMREWLEAESQDFCATDIPALCAALKLAVEQLDAADHELGRPEGLGLPAPVVNASFHIREALTEIANALARTEGSQVATAPGVETSTSDEGGKK